MVSRLTREFLGSSCVWTARDKDLWTAALVLIEDTRVLEVVDERCFALTTSEEGRQSQWSIAQTGERTKGKTDLNVGERKNTKLVRVAHVPPRSETLLAEGEKCRSRGEVDEAV